MLSPDVPEFVPRGLGNIVADRRVEEPAQKHDKNVPPTDDSHNSYYYPKQKPQKNNAGQRNVSPPTYQSSKGRETRDSYGGWKSGSGMRGRTGDFGKRPNDRNSVRSYDNWRQKVDPEPSDRENVGYKNTRKIPEALRTEDENKSKFQQEKNSTGRLKGKTHEAVKSSNIKGKPHEAVKSNESDSDRGGQIVSRGNVLISGSLKENQASSYCKPGLSYGNITSGDYSRGGKIPTAGNNPQNVSGVIPKAPKQFDDQWPSLQGAWHKGATKVKQNEGESLGNQRTTSLGTDEVKPDDRKPLKTEEGNEIGRDIAKTKVLREVSKVNEGKENFRVKEDKRLQTNDERSVDEKHVSQSSTVKQKSYAKNSEKKVIKSVSAKKDQKISEKSSVKGTQNSQSGENRENSDFEWQVKKVRRKQTKPKEEFSDISPSREQTAVQKNNSDHKLSLKPEMTKGKFVPKAEKKVKDQPDIKSSTHGGNNSAVKIEKKTKKSSARQEDQNTTDKPSQQSSVGPVALEGACALPTDAEKTKQKAKKLKKKEEKMKKREQSIRKAQEMMKKDSKLSMITKAFLESAYSGGSGKHAQSFESVPENFPSLSMQRPSSYENRNISVIKNATSGKSEGGSGHRDSSTSKVAVVEGSSWSKTKQSTAGTGRSVTATPSGDSASAHFSYSGVLLSSPKRAATELKPPKAKKAVEGEPSKESINVAPQKKKVRTRDRIELDLFSAALHSKQMKENERMEKRLMELQVIHVTFSY